MPGLTLISLWISILSFFGPPAMKAVVKSTPITFYFEKGSKVSIDGTTNVKDFFCNSRKLFARQGAELNQKDSGNVSFNNAVLEFNIESLDCGNIGMNRDLMKAMKSDLYPSISVKLLNAQFSQGNTLSLSGWTTIKISVSISMAGVTKNAFIVVQGKQIGDYRYRFVGQHSLLMNDFGITPPTAFFGMVKVKDGIIVKFDLIIATQSLNT